jgi:pilus assembly protein FimV
LDLAAADAVEDSGEDAGHGAELGGDLGIDFNPDVEDADESTGVDDAVEATPADSGAGVDELSLDLAAEEDPTLPDATESRSDDFNLDDIGIGVDTDDTDDFDFGDDADVASTKLDLARAYIDMGDEDGARDILNEVLTEGNEDQQKQAQELLETI